MRRNVLQYFLLRQEGEINWYGNILRIGWVFAETFWENFLRKTELELFTSSLLSLSLSHGVKLYDALQYSLTQLFHTAIKTLARYAAVIALTRTIFERWMTLYQYGILNSCWSVETFYSPSMLCATLAYIHTYIYAHLQSCSKPIISCIISTFIDDTCRLRAQAALHEWRSPIVPS